MHNRSASQSAFQMLLLQARVGTHPLLLVDGAAGSHDARGQYEGAAAQSN